MTVKLRYALWALMMGVGVIGCGDKSPPAPTPRFVLTETVHPGAPLAAERLPGEVRARHEVALGFRVAGKLLRRSVEVGDAVHAGQVLAELDAGDLYHSQQGVEAELAAAEAEWRLAQQEVARYRTLRASQFVSQAALDGKETLLKATAEKRAALQSRVSVARNQTGYTQIKADTDGVVTRVSAEPGQVLGVGQPVLTLARSGVFEVETQVPESHIATLQVGKPASATVWALPDRQWPLRVREIAPQADAVTRTYRVRFAFTDNTAAALRLGMSAEVVLAASPQTGSMLLPGTAIFQSCRQAAVWVIVEGRLQLRPVEIVRWREDGAEIRAGLNAGEVIVRAGANKLVAGEAVTPLPR